VSRKPLSTIPVPAVPRERIGDRYELLEIAGRGGMAVVWRAIHHGAGQFRRPVAVKQMHEHLACKPLYRRLFEEEARVGSMLQDPNIAQVLDFVEDDGRYFLVLEWVKGIDLATYIRYVTQKIGERTQWELMAAIGIGILRGLGAAHDRMTDFGTLEPIVHRDVSPHNILISEMGRAKLIDFGLSFAGDRMIEDTDPGMAKGKLAYLAPEIVRGERPSPLTDQFAVGSVLWEALTGRRAFEGPSDVETYKLVANADIEPLATFRDDIPPEFCSLVHRALSLDPSDRFASALDMAWHLGEVLKGRQTTEDLYSILGRTVMSARDELEIGLRTQDPAVEGSISEQHSGLVQLYVDGDDRPSGFRRWIPAFLRNITGG
jgi:serine/threonine-protein kinase